MNLILIFVVFPFVTIVFSIALEKLLNSPFLVAAIIFSVFLILAFTVFSPIFLIAAVVYGFIALITAFIYRLIRRIINRINRNNNDNDDDDNENNDNDIPNTCACRTCCRQRQFCRCMRGLQ